MTGIYQIQSNLYPNRIYIGSAIDITKRWRQHLSLLKLNKHHSIKLQNHYNKYGKNDLIFSILINCKEDDLINVEQSYIDDLNPYFNILKIAGSNKGSHWKLSQKSINNIVAAHIGKSTRVCKVINTKTGEIFNSIKDAANSINIDHANLCSMLNNKRNNKTKFKKL